MIGMKKIARRASCCLAIVALGIIVVNAMSCQVIAQTNSVPFVSSPLVPAAVMPGSPGFILTVNGAGFTTASAVKYNGGSLATHFVSGIKVTASVSASQIISAQTAAITVVNPGPGGGSSNVTYLQVADVPVALGFSGPQIQAPAGVSIATADLRANGKLDVIAANFESNVVSVALGNGNGTFQAPVSYLSGGAEAWSVLAADFNGDGKLDLAVAANTNNPNIGVVSVLLGNGDGTFQGHIDSSVLGSSGVFLFSLVAADFNGDGKLDVAVSDEDGTLHVLLGNGDGTFGSPIDYSLGVTQQPIAVGDFNGDGKLDLAVGGDHIWILLGNGDGTFQTPTETAGPGTEGLAAGDFNNDRKVDLVGTDPRANSAFIMLGNGDGTFQAAQEFLTDVGPIGVAIGDFNADGKLDMAVVAGCGTVPNCGPTVSSTVSVLLGNGDGTFQPQQDFVTPNFEPAAIAAGDFNGDGRLDLVTGASTLAVLLQTTAALSPGALTFPPQNVSTTSSPQTVSLINTASVPLSISGITLAGANPGDYAQTNDCGSSLAAGANCSINVTFTPTAEGTRAALVNVSDDAIGSPQQIALVGTGLAPVVVLNPTSLTFPTQTVGTLSTFQFANLTNAGNLPLSISSITVSGEFFEGNNCKSSLAAGASCTIRVAFKPTTKGPQSGAVTLVDGAGTQTVPLSGVASFLSVSPTSIAFGNVPVGSTSVPHTVTVQNVAANQITFGGVLIKGANSADFAETNTCGTGIPAKGSCTVSVTFTPSKKASRGAALKISGGGGVFSVELSGNGT